MPIAAKRDIEVPPHIVKSSIIDVLKTVYDPEIPVNVYDLGLIYGLTVDPETCDAHITMTLTTPMCPVADILPEECRARAEMVEGVGKCTVELTFDPPWDQSQLSDAARLELNI
jgi:FeS assembly SUF system protein